MNLTEVKNLQTGMKVKDNITREVGKVVSVLYDERGLDFCEIHAVDKNKNYLSIFPDELTVIKK